MTDKIIIEFELELNQEVMQKLEIISKAFFWTHEKFIEFSLKKDIKYIQDCVYSKSFDDLRMEYNTGINEKVLEELLNV